MRRRQMLRLVGAVAAAALWRRPAWAACVLTPQQTLGPFYFDTGLVRRDITEGFAGVPLALRLQVVDARTCQPVPDAVVDIWHANAAGAYSGYAGQPGGVDTRGQTFLRGLQVTDASGTARFDTIYPGWYPGRTAHIHLRVHVDDRTWVTSQLYFPDALSDAVYTTAPYAGRGARTTTNSNDGVLDDEDLDALLLDTGGDAAGYTGALTIAIDLPPAVTPAPSPSPSPTPQACAGDCSGDGAVGVDELVQGINQALGGIDAAACEAFDRDGNRAVTVSELVAAVRAALAGCG